MRGVARPEAVGFAVLLLYMILLTFLSVHLLEENRRLKEEVKACKYLLRRCAMKKVEEYLVLKDSSSTVKLLRKLDCHSIRNGRAILRFPGAIEEYEITNIHIHKGKFRDIVEYELGRCIRCLKLEYREV